MGKRKESGTVLLEELDAVLTVQNGDAITGEGVAMQLFWVRLFVLFV